MARKCTVSVVFGILMIATFILLMPVHASETPLTRAEFAQLIVDLLEIEYDESMAIEISDVPHSSPYYETICILYYQDILRLNGGYYYPNAHITRSEVAAWLNIFGLPVRLQITMPPDVPADFWSYDSICNALKAGVMSVYDDGSFHPGEDAYASDINTSVIRAWLDPTTSDPVSLDLSNGSIVISKTSRT